MKTTALVSAIGLALYATPVLAKDGPRPFVELSAGSSWANKMGLTVGTTPNPTTNGISLTHKKWCVAVRNDQHNVEDTINNNDSL